MRSVLYRFPDLERFQSIVCSSDEEDLELGLPEGEVVEDGEWVLAIFELGTRRRATSAAARAAVSSEGARLVFEPRDWYRLAQFSQTEAHRPSLTELDLAALGMTGGAPWSHGGHAPGARPSSPGFDAVAEGRHGARTTSRTSRPPRPRGGGAKVLVVDDDPDIREMVSVMLEAVELVVTTASSAEEALERARTGSFDLVVLDWNLPRMTGIDLCRQLRREPGLSDLPVLFLTANASSQDMVDAFASGADDYVVKPFRAPELGARIFSLLRRTRRGSAP